MDRLTDIARPALRTRSDPSDLMRTKSARPESNDGVEPSSKEHSPSADRSERKAGKSERFSVRVEAQHAAHRADAASTSTVEEVTHDSDRDEASKDSGAERAAEPEATAGPTHARPAKPAAAASASAPEPTVAKPSVASPEVAQVTKLEAEKTEVAITAPQALPIETKATPAAPALVAAKPAQPEPESLAANTSIEADGVLADVSIPGLKTTGSRANANTLTPTPSNAAVENRPAAALAVATPLAAAPQPAYDLERAADILRQVRVQITPLTQEAQIQLHPAELGRISIHVSIEEGRMRTSVRAEKQEALSAIQSHLPELRVALRQQGIETSDFQFSLGLENQPRRDQGQNPSRPGAARAIAVEQGQPEHALLLRATAAASGIDLYA